MADAKKKRQRKSIGGSSRKNRPPALTPYWHPEVAAVVQREKDKISQEEIHSPLLRDVAKALQEGRIDTWLGHYQSWLLESGDVAELVAHIKGNPGALFLPQIVDAIGCHRARLQNAVGREEWDAAFHVFEELRDALMGLHAGDAPGFPRWFRKCFKLEFEATSRDVRNLKKKYEALSKVRKREMPFHLYLSREMKVGPLAPGTLRELTLVVLADRWGVFPHGVENWLKPALAPGRVRKGEAEVTVIDLGDEEWIIDPNRHIPPSKPGRPPKNRGGD